MAERNPRTLASRREPRPTAGEGANVSGDAAARQWPG